MQFSCYIEINVICMVLAGIFLNRLRVRRSMLSAADKVMVRLMFALVVLCLADVLAIICRGRDFLGARAMIYASNILYLVMMPTISMYWCDYATRKVGREIPTGLRRWYRVPLLAFAAVAVFNPLHHLLFSVNEANLYVRGPAVFVHWLVSWFYFIWAAAAAWRAMRGTTNWIKRSEYKPYLTFMILPAIGSVTQMLMYGVTSVQAGVTLALVLVSFQTQDNQSSSDELTGINNRKAMRRYVDSLINTGDTVTVTAMMIDINHFKQINDTYGHSAGDMALCDLAAALMEVCGQSHEKLFLCRYGGDEFVLAGTDLGREAAGQVMEEVRRAVASASKTRKRDYSLEVSIGWAGGLCRSHEDFEHYLRMADENMYEDKQKLARR